MVSNGGVNLSSIDVARWFIVNNGDVANESMDSKIKLQKLLFYSQAMHLAVTDEPMFSERIEAWKFGPVVREVYKHVEYNNLISLTNVFSDVVLNNLSDRQLKILKTVNFIYGHKTSHELVALTHSESPWKSLEQQAMRAENPIITIDNIHNYYKPLKEVFEAHENFDFDNHKVLLVNGNRFIFNEVETKLSETEINDLWEIGLESENGSFYMYRDDDGELVVY